MIRVTPLSCLVQHPDNPRRGNHEAIRQAIRENGWHGVITARLLPDGAGEVLVGWHRSQAALAEGLDEAPVEWVECSDEEARQIVLSDNKASDMATYDNAILADLLANLDADDFAGTLYTPEDADILRRVYSTPLNGMGTDPNEEWVGMPEFEQGDRTPQHSIAVHFLSLEDKARFASEVLNRDTPPRFAWWPQSDGFIGSDTGSAYVADDGE